MSVRTRLSATVEQQVALAFLAGSRDRGEADRARAVLLTLAGWTSPRSAEAFASRENTVRLWRRDFTSGRVEALAEKRLPRRTDLTYDEDGYFVRVGWHRGG